MRHHDAYELRNLSLPKKLLGTGGLLVGIGLFAATWLSVWQIAQWTGSRRAEGEGWGATLREIAWSEPGAFAVFFFAHFGALAISLIVGSLLFRRSALRRKARAGLMIACVAVGVVDVLVWLTVPLVKASETMALPVAIIEALLLSILLVVPLHQMWIYRRWRPDDGKTKRVVIVGGGFSGLDAVLGLDAKLGYSPRLEIVLIDKNNYFLFPPLLPSVAAGAIETRQVTYPFRRIFETTNVIFRKAEVVRIDPRRQVIHARVSFDKDQQSNRSVWKTSSLKYDYLVLAPGSEVNTFRTPGAVDHAFFMRELSDAVAVRNQVIDCFEQAAAATSRARQRELLTFVICGAGPTGVEVATEIHDLIQHVLLKRYPEIPPEIVSVKLVQSGPGILKGWHNKVVETATRQIGSLDIDLVCDTRVTEIGPRHVTLKSGESFPTRTVVWCAGVRPNPLLERSGLPLVKSGRVEVGQDCRAKGFDNVFVLGDATHFVEEHTGQALPPLGQVAFQQGKHAAGAVIALLRGESPKPFRYFNFGSLVSVGEHFAAVHLLGVRLSGFLGWMVWRSLYLTKLVGLSNKIRVVLDWTLDLLVERSISQIFTQNLPEGVDDVEERRFEPLLPEQAKEILERATSAADLSSAEARIDEDGASAIVMLEQGHNASASVSLTCREGDRAVSMVLEADLPKTCEVRAALTRQEGLLAMLKSLHEIELNDAALDDMFLIDAEETAAPLLLNVKAALVEMGGVSAEIEIDGPLIRVRCEDLTAGAAQAEAATLSALRLWQATHHAVARQAAAAA